MLMRARACLLLLSLLLFAIPAAAQAAPAEPLPYLLRVDLSKQVVIAYTKNTGGQFVVPYRVMVCSTGQYRGDTPLGNYRIYAKYRWLYLQGRVYGQFCSRFNGGILFHSVPYASMNADSLLSLEYNRLGTPASHGCVRLAAGDAEWIYENCDKGTRVEVVNRNPMTMVAIPKAPAITHLSSWDPTDSDPLNPYETKRQMFIKYPVNGPNIAFINRYTPRIPFNPLLPMQDWFVTLPSY